MCIVLVPAPIKVGMKKINDRNLQLHWSPPLNFDQIEDVMSFEVSTVVFPLIFLYLLHGNVFVFSHY